MIDNTDVSAFDIKSLQSVSSALVQIKDVNFVIIANMICDNNLAVVIIWVDTLAVVKFYDCVFN